MAVCVLLLAGRAWYATSFMVTWCSLHRVCATSYCCLLRILSFCTQAAALTKQQQQRHFAADVRSPYMLAACQSFRTSLIDCAAIDTNSLLGLACGMFIASFTLLDMNKLPRKCVWLSCRQAFMCCCCLLVWCDRANNDLNTHVSHQQSCLTA